MNAPLPRFYRSGDLPPKPEDMTKVRRALQRGAMTRQDLIARAAPLSQTRTLCAIDALIASGAVAYDTATRLFSLRSGDAP
jgi:hypothetical protein